MKQPILSPTRDDQLPPEILHFYQLGKLSAAFLHSLATPLTTSNFLLAELEQTTQNSKTKTSPSQHTVTQLQKCLKHIEILSQLYPLNPHENESERWFSPVREIRQVIYTIQPLFPSPIKLEINAEARRVKVYGKRSRFRFVIATLLENAMQAFDQESLVKAITIQLQLRRRGLNIVIFDKGKGLCLTSYTSLFSLKPVTAKTNSHGIGLWLCKYFMQDFKGEISVRSQTTRGTQVKLTFPLPESKNMYPLA